MPRTRTNLLCSAVALLLLCWVQCAHAQDSKKQVTSDKSPSPSALFDSVKPFYSLTNRFLDTVQPAKDEMGLTIIMDSILKNNTSQIDVQKLSKNWDKLAKTYLGYAILIAIGIIFILFMPLVGFCFCCCRCCGRCGGHVKPMERKSARCRRITYNIFLGCITTLMLAGVVLSFITNNLLHESISSPKVGTGILPEVNDSLHQMAAFFQGISVKADKSAKDILREQSEKLPQKVNDSLTIFQVSIRNQSKADIALVSSKEVVNRMSEIRVSLKNITETEPGYRIQHSNLAKDLDPIKTKLLEILNNSRNIPNVATDSVEATKNLIRNMAVTQDLTKIKYSSVKAFYENKNLKDFDSMKIEALIKEANKSFSNMHEVVYKHIKPQLDKLLNSYNNTDNAGVKEALKEAEAILNQMADIFTNTSNQISEIKVKSISGKVVPLQKATSDFDLYRMYAFIGLGCVCLLVVVFYYLGLCFGICGEPPYEDAGLCNRGVGANLLMAGVAFGFLFAWLIMLITMILFLVGAPMHTEACRYLRNTVPNGHETFDKSLLKLSSIGIVPLPPQMPKNMVKGILGDCSKKDSSLVTIFDLTERFDVASLTKVASDALKQMKENLLKKNGYLTNGVNVYPGNLREELGKIEALAVLMNKTSFNASITELSEVVKNYTEILSYLDSMISSTSGVAKANLEKETENLRAAVGPVLASSLAQREHFIVINSVESMKVAKVIFNTDFTNRSLSDKDTREKAVSQAMDNLNATVTKLAQDAFEKIFKAVDNCEKLGETANRFVNVVCVTFLDPFNGIWCGIGWFLLFLIPSIIFAVKLNNIYRKVEKYMKDYEEPDYMAYQGFYPGDNIPLERGSNRHPNIGKGKRSANAGSGSSSGAGRSRPNQPYQSLPSYPAYPDSYE